MQRDVDYSSSEKYKPRLERVRVPSNNGEVYLCFDHSNKRGIHVEITNDEGQTQKIKVIQYSQSRPEAKLNSMKDNNGSVKLFNGIKYERIGAEDGVHYCCRTFAGRRYCRIIDDNDSCEGGVFLE
jgi:hypothetical protein